MIVTKIPERATKIPATGGGGIGWESGKKWPEVDTDGLL